MERRRFRTEGGLTMTECNWCKDEICVNADCPICCDYCPVPDTEGVCKFEDRGKRHFTVHGQKLRPRRRSSKCCCDDSTCNGGVIRNTNQRYPNGLYPICPHCGAKLVLQGNIMTKREYIVEVLQQMETAIERLGGTRAEIWQNDIIYCLCRAVWLLMTWELKKL